MTIQELHDIILIELPSCTRLKKIATALNRVIGKVNLTIDGIFTLEEDFLLSTLSEYSLSNNVLTCPAYWKQIQKVFVDDEECISRPYDILLQDTDKENVFARTGIRTIAFPKAWYFIDEDETEEIAVRSGTAEDEYTFASNVLTLHDDWQKITKVTIASTDYTEKTYAYVLANPSEAEIYAINGRTIVFPASVSLTTATITLTGYEGEPLKIAGIKMFEKLSNADAIDGETEIDMPEVWDEMIVAGTMAHLTGSGEFANEQLHKENWAIFLKGLEQINRWELTWSPQEQENRLSWNYQTVEGK